MQFRTKRPNSPVSRLRLAIGALAVVPLSFALLSGLTTIWVATFMRNQTRLVSLADETNPTEADITSGLPGFPRKIASSSDGSLWVETRAMGSLSRYHDGRWEVFRGNTIGTRDNVPSHGFVVVENQVWAVFDKKLAHFDGQQWKTYQIPSTAKDHLVAATSQDTWVLGNDSSLQKWSEGNWQTMPVRSTLEESQWNPEKTYRIRKLVACDDGSLWLCSRSIWRFSEDQWKPAGIPGWPTNPRFLGYAGDRLWFDGPAGLLWISEDAADNGSFTLQEMGLESDDQLWDVDQFRGNVVAASDRGGHVLRNGQWELQWPRPEKALRYQALAATGNQIYAQVFTLQTSPILWLFVPVSAMLSAMVLAGVIVFLKPSYSLLSLLRWRHLLVALLVLAPVSAAGISQTTWTVVVFIAPFAISMFLLSLPALALALIWSRERLERRTELIQPQAVPPEQLPQAARRWFEENTTPLQSLGFEPVGDYRLKQRREQFGRFFLHPDGTIFAEIAWAKLTPIRTARCVNFFSITEDLTYVETGNIPLPREERDDRFVLTSVPSGTPAETLEAHCDELDNIRQACGSGPIAFSANDLDKVVTHGQRLLYDIFTRRGMLPRNPYEDVEIILDRDEASDSDEWKDAEESNQEAQLSGR